MQPITDSSKLLRALKSGPGPWTDYLSVAENSAGGQQWLHLVALGHTLRDLHELGANLSAADNRGRIRHVAPDTQCRGPWWQALAYPFEYLNGVILSSLPSSMALWAEIRFA